MKLSLSVRVAEAPGSKKETIRSFDEVSEIASQIGYQAVCMRASQVGIQTALQKITSVKKKVRELDLAVSMVTGDFPIPINNDQGPSALRNIAPYLELAVLLGSNLIRIAMKTEEDIIWAQRASDEANERNVRLAHQSHTLSLFETVDGSLDVLNRVNRPNFGLIYEPANLDLCGQDYGIKTIKKFAPHLFNVYLQNHVQHPKGKVLAQTWINGHTPYDPIRLQDQNGIDFPLVFQGLKEIGYHGYITVHQAFADIMTPENAARQSFDYLTQLADFEVKSRN